MSELFSAAIAAAEGHMTSANITTDREPTASIGYTSPWTAMNLGTARPVFPMPTKPQSAAAGIAGDLSLP